MERVAILGARGQLGTDLVRQATAEGLAVDALDTDSCDITDPAAVERAFAAFQPDVVINSAAFHQAEACESDPLEAFRVNTVGALHVARAAAAIGARSVLISTDYVFDGALPPGRLYPEDAPTGPLNVYGTSKRAAEHAVRAADDTSLVCRVSSLFGEAGSRGKGGNFVETMVTRARDGLPLKVVNDQWMTPTYTADAAGAILALCRHQTAGIVHVTNPEACTWHDLAQAAITGAGIDLDLPACTAAEFPSPARRPQNSALATDRLASLVGPLPTWRDMLDRYLVARGYREA